MLIFNWNSNSSNLKTKNKSILSTEEWMKTKQLLLPLKKEYKENYGLGLDTSKVMLVLISILLTLVEDKINESLSKD